MGDLNIIEIFLTVGIMVAGWFLRMLHDNHKELENKVNANQMETGEKYVRRDDYRNDLNEIKSMLDKIFNRLDEKADKQ
jgi:hypothetical protein